jgi:ribosomal protein L11 methyltransferase
MPYRIDLRDLHGGGDAALDRLIELGALDVERLSGRGIAALMPDRVSPDAVADALGAADARPVGIVVSPAVGRDADSVWVLRPRPVRAGRTRIVPAAHPDASGADLELIDAPAFGTGLHPTTVLCLEALDAALQIAVPDSVLDVGIGSGVLALAALRLGVPRAHGLDIDDGSLETARENARINGLLERLTVTLGGPDVVPGTWPLVLANVLAAPLMEMAPALVRRVAPRGRVVLSGMPISLERDVGDAYRRLGMRTMTVTARAGWSAIVLEASW